MRRYRATTESILLAHLLTSQLLDPNILSLVIQNIVIEIPFFIDCVDFCVLLVIFAILVAKQIGKIATSRIFGQARYG